MDWGTNARDSSVMKISNNPSRQGIRWRWNSLRLIAASLVLAAFWYTNRVGELTGAGIVVFVLAYVSKAWEEDFLIVVFDDGDRMRFELDGERLSVSLNEIEKAKFHDGGDGKDTVTISFCSVSPFGRYVEFAPELNHRFQGDPKLRFDDLEMRITEAKTKATKDVIEVSDEHPRDHVSVGGQTWM